MRKELLYNPLLMLERLGKWATEKQRLRKLKGTIAAHLTTGHIGSLELLELLRVFDIKVIYDIGANVGTWTLLAKSLFPEAEVHAFEPLDQHIDSFRKATLEVSGITLHEVALGDSDGFADLHVTSFSDASSILPLADKGTSQWGLTTDGQVRVRIESLDNRIERLSLAPPDLIKLDIQGYELVALNGGLSALKHAQAVLLEVSFTEIYCRQAEFHAVVGFLADHGFSLDAFGHGVAPGHRLLQADALFMKTVS